MAGWGAIGVFGALLARLVPRPLGRVPLALACGAAGLGFGAVMNLHLWITYSGDHTLAKLGAYFATSLPFDLAHAFGNVVFCLAFGPALVRALQRFRTRMEVRWLPAPGRGGRGAAGRGARGRRLAAPRPRAPRAPTPRPPRPRCATWPAPRTTTAAGAARPASARRSCTRAGRRSASPPPGATRATSAAPTAIDFTRRRAGELDDLGELSRTILVFTAAGLSPRDVGGRDLVAELLRKRKANGSFAGRVNTTAFAALALKAAGRSPSSGALRGAGRWIAGQANPDGGFNFAGRGGPSGIDDTGAAIQGLAAAGRKRTRTVARAARFLVRRQNADGGFPLVPGGASNAQSTAWAVQGLLAAGRDPAKVRRLARPAGLPALAHLRLGRGPLLAHQPPDARLGDRAGRDGARAQAAAAGAGRARPPRRRRSRGARAARHARGRSRVPQPRAARKAAKAAAPRGARKQRCRHRSCSAAARASKRA